MANTETLFTDTMHPYSISLLSAVPRVSIDAKIHRILLKGDIPSPINPGPGCRFAPRCWMAKDLCRQQDPILTELSPGHLVACHYSGSSRELSRSAEKSG